MAKKKPSKKAAKKPATRIKHENDDDPNFQPGPQPEPIDPFQTLDLSDVFESIAEPMYEKFGYRSKAETLSKEVGKLRAELAMKEAELRHELGPMLSMYQALTSKQTDEARYYDEPLRRMLKNIRMKAREYGYGAEEPTGAKPWAELQKEGASDQQIAKNVKSIKACRDGDYVLDLKSNNFELVMVAGESDIAAPILKGEKALVPEVRRVMGIKQASKGAAKAPAKKPTTVKKKPAPKRKSSKPGTSPLKNKAAKAGRKSTAKKKSSKPPIGKLVKGKATVAKRNEVRKEFGGEEPIDEELAGQKALQEEREFTEKFGDTSKTVVVDRTRKKAAKGTVRNPRATPFARTPK